MADSSKDLVSQGATSQFPEHEQRRAILGELHARPALPITMPRRIYRFAFQNDHDAAIRDRENIVQLAKSRGVAPPAPDARFHSFDFGPWDLRWEQHTEFTTYTWSTGRDAEKPLSHPNPLVEGEIAIEPPGPLVSAIHISLIAQDKPIGDIGKFFHPESLCVINAAANSARVTTDFQADQNGFTRFIVESKSLTDTRAGRLVSRLLEIETYRTFALLGLPAARKVAPEIRTMGIELEQITRRMAETIDHESAQELMHRLLELSARSEQLSSKTAFRFGATRAYYALVKTRLEMIKESEEGQYPRISTFFRRRMEPAMDTCDAAEVRMQRLSRNLTRAADLLRTNVQFGLEEQNRDLLKSMDRRAKLQLRLQETVEGLSIAAISYYMVGLITYLAKGLKDASLLPAPLTPAIVTAVSVPLVILIVFLVMRRVRKSFAKADEPGSKSPPEKT